MNKLKVNVTEHHIENGQPRRESSCPVAMAIMSNHDVHYCSVWANSTILSKKLNDMEFEWYEYKHNEEVNHWIQTYDGGDSVNPISFELNKSSQWTSKSGSHKLAFSSGDN